MNIYESSCKRLGCLIINEGNEYEGSSFCFQCSATHICVNDKCFWKQRDCYGLCPWLVLDNPEHDVEQAEIRKTYGEPYFPEWEVCVSTNCLMCSCKDFIK